MSVYSHSAAGASAWPPRGALLDSSDVAAVLDTASEQTPDTTTAIYAAWNRDRLRQRLASRQGGWMLPPLVGGLQLFVLHPTASPGEEIKPSHPLLTALKRRGYSLILPGAHGRGGSSIGTCQLLIVVISATSAWDLWRGQVEPWANVFAAAGSIPYFGALISGDTLPPPLTLRTVVDLRDAAYVDQRVGRVFPEREVMVVGERGDRSVKTIGLIKASDLDRVRGAVEYLDDLGEFFSIRLVC